MSRGLSPAMIAALADPNLRLGLFFEGQFPSGYLRLWSGIAPISWAGQTWTGAGSLIGMGPVEETSSVVATGSSVSLSGIPTDLVAACISDARQGQSGKIWLGLLTEAGAIVADPDLIFAGRLDVPTIIDDADTCTISISYESRLIDLNRPREFRYTDESQKLLFPGDRGFEYVTVIQDREITWGRTR